MDIAQAQEIASWMITRIREQGMLRQEEAIAYVREQYGEEYLFTSGSGNISLDKEIKKAFRKQHGGRVAWDRDGFFWAWT